MKKKLIPILLCLMVIFSVFALGACDNGGECEHEYGTLKAEVAASCSQDGTVAHYTCAKCGLKFDKDYNQILDLKINKTEHTYSDEFDADCNKCNAKRVIVLPDDVVIDGKYATLTYADGTTLKIELSIGEVECAHTSVKSYELIAHTASDKGTYLDICNSCDMKMIVSDVRHDMSAEPVKVDPTCTDDGSVTEICTICGTEGNVTVIDKLGHDCTDPKFVLDPGKNLCVDGGLKFSYCTRCDYTNIETILPIENIGIDGSHTVNNWTAAVEPDFDNEGMLTGTCEVCSAVVNYTLPSVNDADYTITVVKERENCTSTDGIAECVFNTANDANQTFTFSVALPVAVHQLNGNDMDLSVKYDVRTPGIVEKAGSPVKCSDDNATANFTCDVCSKIVEIGVYLPHTVSDDIWQITLAPTCTETGILSGECEADGCDKIVNRDVDALGHTYEFEDRFDITESDEGIIYTIYGACVRECDGAVCAESIVLSFNEADVEIDVIAATCTESGFDNYIFPIADGITHVVSIVTEKLHHVFGDIRLPNIDTITYYIDEYPGLEEFADRPVVCYEDCYAHYTCPDCEQVVKVTVRKYHTVTEDSWVINPAPTCTENGLKSAVCAAENCDAVVSEEIDALGHSFEYYAIEYNANNDCYAIYATCVSCGESEAFEVINPIIDTVNATCTATGTVTYYCAVNGETVIYTEVLPIVAHTLGGVSMDNDANTPYIFENYNGLVEFGNVTITCHTPAVVCYVCDCCNGVIQVTAVKKHTVLNSTWVIDKAPTCTEDGIRHGICIANGCESTVTETIAATGHKYSYIYDEENATLTCNCKNADCTDSYTLTEVSVTINRPATCSVSGIITYTGINEAGESVSVSDSIPTLSHTAPVATNELDQYPLTDGIVYLFYGQSIDCHNTANGYFVCTGCGKNITVTVYQPHVFESDAIIVEPTCTETGLMKNVCTLCGDEGTEPIAALGHSYDFKVAQIPTLEGIGIAQGVCTSADCGHKYPDLELPVLDSDSYNITIDVMADCINNGYATYLYEFTVDNVVYSVSFTVEIAALGHMHSESAEYTFTYTENVVFVYGGEEIEASVDVNYLVFECQNENCFIHILLNKCFTYEGVTYVYSDSSMGWIATVA